MNWWKKVFIAFLLLAGAIASGLYWYISTYDEREPSRLAYAEHCTDCHGKELEGSGDGPALSGRPLTHGDDTAALITSISQQHGNLPEADWQNELSPAMIKALALYISEQRQRIPTIIESQVSHIPEGVVRSQHHDFSVELITELQSGPYAIAPLPDGSILVSEKVRGLSRVSPDGTQGPLLAGTPKVWEEIIKVRGSYVGIGMMLDVELHPEYEHNGWIYLSHSDRCQLDCGSLFPVSMVRVIRGRLENERWTDSEEIWAVHREHYTVVPDGVAAGRLAFDGQGHLFVTVGGKASYDNLHELDTPYGKIHRVRDDGSVPGDNPFWKPPEARVHASTRHTVWSYGHRTTQGLAAHPESGAIWSTEMGPRGGDEINLIVAGGNYGWPLYTNGLDYNGKPITIGQDIGLNFPLSQTVRPVVDFTPAPALSNFTFHHGDRFPRWEQDLLVGSLRARTLYRVRIHNGDVLEQEKLLDSIGRIRDVEMGIDGLVYILIEHSDGGSLVRLVPR
jgi:glucose/arabinose dehydrogenase